MRGEVYVVRVGSYFVTLEGPMDAGWVEKLLDRMQNWMKRKRWSRRYGRR